MISTREEAESSPAQIFSNQVQGGVGVLVNRTGVDGAVLLTPLLLTDEVTQLYFSSKSSRYHNSQTVRAMELKF